MPTPPMPSSRSAKFIGGRKNMTRLIRLERRSPKPKNRDLKIEPVCWKQIGGCIWRCGRGFSRGGILRKCRLNLEEMAQLLSLGLQIFAGGFLRGNLDRNPFDDLQS